MELALSRSGPAGLIIHNEVLRERILSRSAHLAVIGLGYVGLPLAITFEAAGYPVTGVDINEERVNQLNQGKSPIGDVSAEDVRQAIERRRFSATTSFSSLDQADVIFLCVPTPISNTKEPDLTYVTNAARSLVHYLRPGQLVILESTTYPGTTEEVVLPILESTGLREGHDFYLAFSPERVDPGNRTFSTRNTPKVVGGVSQVSGQLARLLYSQVIGEDKVTLVSSARAAEMTKLLENTFRAVNIALVNEFALLCERMGIDVWEVIDAAATKPFGFMPFYPGPGVGGHCIPVDPYYLAWKAREYDFNTKFIELAAETNSQMPFQVVHAIADVLNTDGKPLRNADVFVVGAAFKPNVEDYRNSPAVKVMALLQNKGAKVRYHDPHVPAVDLTAEEPVTEGPVWLESTGLTKAALQQADVVVILVDHDAIDWGKIVRYGSKIIDTRNALRRRFPDIDHAGLVTLWGKRAEVKARSHA